jgi:hypothetical protein
LREQRQETVHNYLDSIDTLYEGLIFKPYWNKVFYPNGTIDKYHAVMIQAIKDRLQSYTNKSHQKNTLPQAEVVNKALSPDDKTNVSKKSTLKSMKMLAKCQSNYMQVIL